MTDIARERVEALHSADRSFAAAGMELVEVGDGRATVAMTGRPEMTNGAGVIHGGWLFLLADTAFASAAATRLPGSLTTEADIRFHRPAHVGDRLTASATVVTTTGTTVLVDVAVTDPRGERIASFRGGGRAPRQRDTSG